MRGSARDMKIKQGMAKIIAIAIFWMVILLLVFSTFGS